MINLVYQLQMQFIKKFILIKKLLFTDSIIIIGLSGKFVPMLKENWNAENFNLINTKI